MRIVGRSSERNSYEVLFELREENRETHSIQKVRFLLRTMPRIVHDHPMSLKPSYRLFIFTSKMVRGVGFEPTKAYATGWLTRAVGLVLSLARVVRTRPAHLARHVLTWLWDPRIPQTRANDLLHLKPYAVGLTSLRARLCLRKRALFDRIGGPNRPSNQC